MNKTLIAPAERRNGPRIEILASCLGCKHHAFSSYCDHPRAPSNPELPTTETPHWCPLLDAALEAIKQ